MENNLKPSQADAFREVLDLIDNRKEKRIVLKGSAGTGKLQPLSEPVLSSSGWVLMKDIVVGSKVMCPVKGRPVEVTEVFPQQDLSIYRVEFDDGTFTECCDDHLWKVRVEKDYVIMSLKDIIKQGLHTNKGEFKFKIPLTNPLDFDYMATPLSPYLLGFLLGYDLIHAYTDSNISLAVSALDAEDVLKNLQSAVPSNVTVSLEHRGLSEFHSRLIVFSKELKPYLERVGLLGVLPENKFIPEDYAINSLTTRKLLLAGLMDSDGFCDISAGKDKTLSYSTTSMMLTTGIISLVRSLGGKAINVNRRDNSTKKGKVYTTVIRLNFNPFYRTKKKKSFNSLPTIPVEDKCISAVTFMRKEGGQCISVDSPDHLYITRDYTVTHNTYLTNHIVRHFADKLSKWDEAKIFVTAPTNKALSVLQEKIGPHRNIVFKTVHAALKLKKTINKKTGVVNYLPSYGKESPFENCILAIVDECSMLSSNLISFLDEFAFPLIFIGDDKQLNPVGEIDTPIFNRTYPTVSLNTIIRQGEGNPIIDLSRDLSLIWFREPKIIDGKGYLYNNSKVQIVENLAQVNGTDELKYLAWTNEDVNNINKAVRERLYTDPKKVELGESIIFKEPYDEYWNNQEIKVKNLEITTLPFNYPNVHTKISKTGGWIKPTKVQLKVYRINNNIIVLHEDSQFEYENMKAELRTKCNSEKWDWRGFFLFQEQFANITYNHALSVHKSQGSTFKEVVINAGNINFNTNIKEKERLFYTAVTRASDLVILVNV